MITEKGLELNCPCFPTWPRLISGIREVYHRRDPCSTARLGDGFGRPSLLNKILIELLYVANSPKVFSEMVTEIVV